MKLFTRVIGVGPPIIVLHGLYGSSDNWMGVARDLSGSFKFILPDLRNHGNSPHHPIMDYSHMADDVVEVCINSGHNKYFLAGHSMGGKVAALIALKYPELIQGLIIADISPFSTTDPKGVIVENHKRIIEGLANFGSQTFESRREAEEYMITFTGDKGTAMFLAKNITRSAAGEYRLKLNIEAIENNSLSIFSSILDDQHDGFQAVSGFPVFIIKGEKSNYINEGDLSSIKTLFPAAEMTIIKDAGHWLHAEKRKEVCSEFLKLLE